MAILGTPVHAVLVFHLTEVDLDALTSWTPGVYRPDRVTRPEVAENRTTFYHDDAPLQELIGGENRRWVSSGHERDGVRLLGAEVIRHRTTWTTFGHLVLHVTTTPEAQVAEAWGCLGLLARAGSEAYREFLASLPECPTPVPGRRAAALLVSGMPPEDESGMVRWPGSTALERRLADLVTLRQRSVTVPSPFVLDVESPTPSYRLAASGHTAALVRLQRLEVERHGDLLRSTWLDAFMLELVQYEALRDLETRVRDEVRTDADWRRLADSFRGYRLQQVWSAGSDHPLERALARRLRAELGTDAVLDRLQQELDDHVAAAAAAASSRLNASLFVLAVGALLIPLLVAVDAQEAGWGLLAAWALSLLLVAVLVTAMVEPRVLRALRERLRRGGTRT